MGSICPKKIPPYEAKSVVELAERVVDKFIDDKKKVSGDARSSIETSCAEEFWKDYRMKVKKKEVEVNRLIFLYLVLVTWLEKVKENRGQVLEILTSIKNEFFTDPDMVECAISFQDVHKNLHKIYIGLERVVSPVNGIVETVTLNELIQNLVLLKSDPVIKDELDATYKLFLKDMRSKPYKPSKIAEQCILSLL